MRLGLCLGFGAFLSAPKALLWSNSAQIKWANNTEIEWSK